MHFRRTSSCPAKRQKNPKQRTRIAHSRMSLWHVLTVFAGAAASPLLADNSQIPDVAVQPAVAELQLTTATSVIDRMLMAGPVVSLVLLILASMSVFTWAIFLSKWLYLKRIHKNCEAFIKSFWDSRSLNDLNSRLLDYPYSPVREVFRSGYAELVRGSQMRESGNQTHSELAMRVAIDNLSRSLQKSRQTEKQQLERYLPVLAISASACPFIGLFGTVWGIMTAFEGIARSGSSSLAAVAPGISEALVATAFGLAAAIPAAVGYNIAAYRIRGMMAHLDGFGHDFLNIVERYLFTDKFSNQNRPARTDPVRDTSTPGVP